MQSNQLNLMDISSDLNIKEYRLKRHIPLSKQQIEACFQAKNLYEQHGTLQKVAEILHLSRERVRQLLNRGQKNNLFAYTLTREKILLDLAQKISKENIVETIRLSKNRYEVCLKLKISIFELYRLLKFYNMDVQDHILDARTQRWLNGYSRIVDTLGHHPSTTEMQSKKEWRNIWHAINRLWSGIDKFRKEYGIEKPIYVLHPNTIRAFKQAAEKRTANKKIKITQLLDFIKRQKSVNIKTMSDILGFKKATLAIYLSELKKQNAIKIIRKGHDLFYFSND